MAHANQYTNGAKMSPETKEKICKAEMGRKLSAETKQKISRSMMGNKNAKK